jgi:hypothetical protein
MASDPHSVADAETAATAERVLDYLRRHRRAADTWEGIATWWLAEGPETKPEAVRAALEGLAAAGLVKARRLPTGEWLYGAAFGDGTPEGAQRADSGGGETWQTGSESGQSKHDADGD